MSTIDEKRRQLMKAFSELSEEEQRAMTLIISNYDEIKRVCLAKKLTFSQREEMMADALKRNDSFRLALLCFERVINGE